MSGSVLSLDHNITPKIVNIMKIIYSITLVFVFCNLSFSQQISRSVISSSGDFAKNDKGVSICWTIGEVFSASIIQVNHITEGFQQGSLNNPKKVNSKSVLNFVDEVELNQEQEIEVSIYPNPTQNRLMLRFGKLHAKALTAKIFDINGREVLAQRINYPSNRSVKINEISFLPSGSYFIKLIEEGKTIKTQSIIKT